MPYHQTESEEIVRLIRQLAQPIQDHVFFKCAVFFARVCIQPAHLGRGIDQGRTYHGLKVTLKTKVQDQDQP